MLVGIYKHCLTPTNFATKSIIAYRIILLQEYSNIEIYWFYIGNISSTFVLSSFSVCSNCLSSLTSSWYLFFKFTPPLLLLYFHNIWRTIIKIIEKQKVSLSNSWHIRILVYLFIGKFFFSIFVWTSLYFSCYFRTFSATISLY